MACFGRIGQPDWILLYFGHYYILVDTEEPRLDIGTNMIFGDNTHLNTELQATNK
jgi:hypothetical protein